MMWPPCDIHPYLVFSLHTIVVQNLLFGLRLHSASGEISVHCNCPQHETIWVTIVFLQLRSFGWKFAGVISLLPTIGFIAHSPRFIFRAILIAYHTHSHVLAGVRNSQCRTFLTVTGPPPGCSYQMDLVVNRPMHISPVGYAIKAIPLRC